MKPTLVITLNYVIFTKFTGIDMSMSVSSVVFGARVCVCASFVSIHLIPSEFLLFLRYYRRYKMRSREATYTN